jgi:hypothetical protein
MDESKKISVIDYVVFGISLLIPVLIAAYYTFVKKQVKRFAERSSSIECTPQPPPPKSVKLFIAIICHSHQRCALTLL